MPTKKSVQEKLTDGSFDIQKLMQNSDSYKSLIYGIVTVVVLFIVIALGVRTLQQNKAQIDEEAISTMSQTNKTESIYTVTEGDTLWSIAEKTYNDGFAWTEIAKVNNITDASKLEKGMTLTLPKIDNTNVMATNTEASASPTQVPTPTTIVVPTDMQQVLPDSTRIAENSYIIVHGDNLWDIAVRAYGDGYRWVDIAKSNNIPNPDLIYAGDSLKL